MSNFPLGYKLSWLPRLLRPSMAGSRQGLLPAEGVLLPLPEGGSKRLVFLGDISSVANRSAPEIDDGLRALIASADLVVGNCEAPVVERPRRPLGTLLGSRHAMTAGFLSAMLRAAGIAPSRLVLSLANNHMLDQGVEGFAETRSSLDALGIATVGGADGDGARMVELDGLTLALGAFTQWRNAEAEAFAGRVIMRDDFLRGVLPTLGVRKADLLCVVAHWDLEFRHLPSEETKGLAQALAENGAGLIVGHHAHVVQPAGLIGGAMVAYGLGDFLGTALPRSPWPTRLGAVLAVDISIDPVTKGRVAGWRFVPFFRRRAGDHEKLMPLEAVAGPQGERARQRFAAIFPDAPGLSRIGRRTATARFT